ncbi:uncharacterized protein VDAG_02388 [Verticillium dahliae VdLs.17]|uniref:MULE transposase domain-containing protein n=2 Tax=Verticillium dahliae TaxID=27337 RepID=G2WXQ6_VERDV|nr:uncharacterized protein VDAG_02388 [Verticillium dahliae VdLs.17]AER39699.1 transposase [Verticillium dahliae]EGY20864.1 hypothetical protein VDAG_02388 [Verticillium dahliae VdLs.17]
MRSVRRPKTQPRRRSSATKVSEVRIRLTTTVRATIESISRRVGIRARDVRAVVQEQHPESTFTQRDIYNARALINRDKLNGHTPTAALIKLFDEMGVPYLVKWADDEPNRLVGLVWTFPYCLQMWKRFPEVISFDNTYNTNRFKLPLFQATGQTCLGSVFNAAFGLIDNERREGFQFLSESIRQLAEQHSIRPPDTGSQVGPGLHARQLFGQSGVFGQGDNLVSNIFDGAACVVSSVIGGGNPRCRGKGSSTVKPDDVQGDREQWSNGYTYTYDANEDGTLMVTISLQNGGHCTYNLKADGKSVADVISAAAKRCFDEK